MAIHPDVTTTADLSASLAAEALPPLPKKRGEPVFASSWEAEAYAMGNILVKEGLISCRQWMDLMAEAIRSAQEAGDPDNGDTYYNHWCAALERFCMQMGWISAAEYQQLLSLWAQAIANTPHGVPLSLANAGAAAPLDEHAHHHHHHDHQRSGDLPPDHYWTPLHVTRLSPGSPSA